jgi:hypothetical protein
MTVQLREKRHFDRSSPVLQYWLANCEGFRIAGAAGGRVEELVAEIDARRPDELVVRGRLGLKRVVPTRAVEAIVPAEKLLILDTAALGRKTARARRQRSLAATQGAAVASGRLLRRAAVHVRPRVGRVVDAALVAAEALSLLALRAMRAALVLVLRGTIALGQAVERGRRRAQERRVAGASPQLVRHRARASTRAHAAGRRTRDAVTHARRGLSRRTSYR